MSLETSTACWESEAASERSAMKPRAATPLDVQPICELVNGYARQGIMLPLSPLQVTQQLPWFWVVGSPSNLAGCGALKDWRDGSMEVRALAVQQESRGKRMGQALVRTIDAWAQSLGARVLFALTLEPDFFLRQGFELARPEGFPLKVKHDCGACARRANCRELTVAKYY